MIRIPYVTGDNRLIGYAVMVRAPDPPEDVLLSHMGWPEPLGHWKFVDVPGMVEWMV